MPTSRTDPAVELPLPCVVLCPPDHALVPPPWYEDCRAALIARSFVVLTPTAPPTTIGDPSIVATGRWVAAVATAARGRPAGLPLLVVAVGSAVSALPALARAEHARGDSIVGYVLVDADLAPLAASPDWPGAPVTYVRTLEAPELGWRLAALRGWRTFEADPVDAVLDATARAAGTL